MSIATVETAVEGAATVAKVGLGALSWLPWAIAAGSLIGGAGGTLWYRSEWKDCQASVAIEAAKAEAAVNAAKTADAKFKNELADQLAPIRNAIQESKNATQVALAKVQSNPVCGNTAAAAAFDSGVRPSPVKADPGPARPARP